MILPDVNVLLYAFRPDTPEHPLYKAWLDSVLNGRAAYGMSPQVLAALIRISTHRRIYSHPTPLPEAIAFAKYLLTPPHCQIVQPGPRHWDIYCHLCETARATGNMTQDAWFAAMAIESGCEWITADRDFARFEGLRWRSPF